MSRSVHPSRDWLNAKEDEHREFKEAKNNFHFEKLVESLLPVVPSRSRSSVKRLLDELRQEGRVHPIGTKRNVRWFPGSAPGFGSENPAKGRE